MIQFHSPQHGSMCSSINVVGVACVVVTGLLLLPHIHENMFLANRREKHPRLLREVQTHHAKLRYMFSFLASFTLKCKSVP
jgi:hypothetical protein